MVKLFKMLQATKFFSSDGKINAVSNTLKAVNKEYTSLAVRGRDVAVVATHKIIPNQLKLINTQSVQHIFHITPRIGCVVIGCMPDCRSIVQRARIEAVRFEQRYGYSIPASTLTRRIAGILQVYTQTVELRMQACALILVSYDDEKQQPVVFEVTPNGEHSSCWATSFGKHKAKADKYLTACLFPAEAKGVRNCFNNEETIKIAINCLKEIEGAEFNSGHVEIGIIGNDKKFANFEILSAKDINGYVSEDVTPMEIE